MKKILALTACGLLMASTSMVSAQTRMPDAGARGTSDSGVVAKPGTNQKVNKEQSGTSGGSTSGGTSGTGASSGTSGSGATSGGSSGGTGGGGNGGSGGGSGAGGSN